ncbi:hypothetical protein THARTR1_09155 [Trichoderma harzianum]|uniref:Uncharacterized protein n=1 Tax=Trichoderma harzianum TaxID=5544 RepID=A0A2K0TXF3_TRIHA|nr:hypothetical protein THARTR1_09155 [Trichoderma harzianum]
MSNKPEPSSGALQPQQQKKRGILPPELIDLIVAPVKVGSFTGKLLILHSWQTIFFGSNMCKQGAAGVLAGVAGAIARDTSPVASGAVTGFQWFALGGSFWCKFILPLTGLLPMRVVINPIKLLGP